MTEPLLQLRSLSKFYGAKEALAEFELSVPAGSLTVILGPAGAGKTTLLRTIAGLEEPTAGAVLLGGRDIVGLQPRDRGLAMIFDNLALYPTKTVFENIAFPLRVAGISELQIKVEVERIAALLHMEHTLTRLPRTLSGGERQRVALGRALVRDPTLFLLDEPLSSLDAMLRLELRATIKRLQRGLGKTFLYATPDFGEALAIADTIVVLFNGRLQQIAPPQVLYEEPANREVAKFVGNPPINLIEAQYSPGHGGGKLQFGSVDIGCPHWLSAMLGKNVTRVELGIRSEDVSLHRKEPSGHAIWGEVVDVELLGLHATVNVNVGGVVLRASVAGELDEAFSLGNKVAVALDPEHIHAFEVDTGLRLPNKRSVAPGPTLQRVEMR